MPSLVKNQRNSQSQTCDRADCDRKVLKRPLLALCTTPSICKRLGGRRWWNIRYSYNRKIFGGLYSVTERDRILEIFDGTTGQVTPQEFELIAERIIAETTRRQGAAS